MNQSQFINTFDIRITQDTVFLEGRQMLNKDSVDVVSVVMTHACFKSLLEVGKDVVVEHEANARSKN